jgi:hypothetical protein
VSLIDYDKPFSAGQIAKVLPGSLALDYAISFNDIVLLRDEAKRLDTVRLNDSRSTLRAEMGQASNRVVDFIGSIAHERDHVRRFLSTSFAFMCDAVRCHIVRVVASIIGRHGYKIFSGRNTRSEELAELYQLQNFLYAITDGTQEAVSRSDFRNVSLVLGSQSNRISVSDSTTPLDTGINPVALNTRHIFEMFAILEHGNGLSRKACPIDDVEALINSMSGEYRQLIRIWNSVFGWADIGKITSQSRAKGDLPIEWYRLMPFEFYVAADLALWSPYLPGQPFAIDAPYDWHDICPASRFIRILIRFEQIGLKPTPIPVANRNEQFLEMQAAICRFYNWPTPQFIANNWLSRFVTDRDTGLSTWNEVDGPSMYRMDNSIRLLRLRQSSPCDLALNNIDFVQHKIDRPPVWIFTEPDGRKKPLPIRRTEPTLLLPFIVLELTHHLVTKGRASMSFLYERKFREIAISEYCSVLSQIGEWSGSLEGQLHEYLFDTVITAQDQIENIHRKTTGN